MPKKLTQSEDYLRRAINTANRRLDVLKDAYGKTSDTYLLNYDLYEDPMFSKFVRNGKLSQDLRRSLKSETEMEEYANILLEKVETLSQSYSVAEKFSEQYKSKLTKEEKIELQKEISTAQKDYSETIKQFYEVENFVDDSATYIKKLDYANYVSDTYSIRNKIDNHRLMDDDIAKMKAMINKLDELRDLVDKERKKMAEVGRASGKNASNYGKDLGGRQW